MSESWGGIEGLLRGSVDASGRPLASELADRVFDPRQEDKQFAALLQALENARDHVVQAERDKLPSADVLELRTSSYQAWQAAEEYRRKTGCSPYSVP